MAYDIEIAHGADIIVKQLVSSVEGLAGLKAPQSSTNMEGCNNYIHACEELLNLMKAYQSLVAKDGAEISKFIAEMRQLDSNA